MKSEQLAIIKKVVRVGLHETVTFKQRLGGQSWIFG